LAYLGRNEAYETACRQIVSRFTKPMDAGLGEAAMRSCLLLRGSRVKEELVQEWLESARAKSDMQTLLTRGLALYRHARYEAALECLSKPAQDSRGHAVRAAAEFVSALAHHHLGSADAAAAALARGKAIVDRKLPRAGAGDLAEGGLRDWLACQVLFREVQSVVAMPHAVSR
jgi:hypothetical protein